MQTQPEALKRTTPRAQEAESILRRCVHCGFCNAVCPTYQLLGDEQDGPRGRIYFIKQLLEGQAPGDHVRQHLDRCLLCRSCETTCPSGVDFHTLMDIGRAALEHQQPRSKISTSLRAGVAAFLTTPSLLNSALRLGRLVRPLLPQSVRRSLPEAAPRITPLPSRGRQRVILLAGCVENALSPRVQYAALWLLDRLGFDATIASGCCGALGSHLQLPRGAKDLQKLTATVTDLGAEELIVSTASGCGAFLKDSWQGKPVGNRLRDISQVLAPLEFPSPPQATFNLALQIPCSYQHALNLPEQPMRQLLQRANFQLVPVAESHLCCGSAGTYSIFQPQLAQQLRQRKLDNLQRHQPSGIATANIGCLLYLRQKSSVPCGHWIEWLAWRLGAPGIEMLPVQ